MTPTEIAETRLLAERSLRAVTLQAVSTVQLLTDLIELGRRLDRLAEWAGQDLRSGPTALPHKKRGGGRPKGKGRGQGEGGERLP
jgi:hypothetical protein